jgi:hypothetical protein
MTIAMIFFEFIADDVIWICFRFDGKLCKPKVSHTYQMHVRVSRWQKYPFDVGSMGAEE